MYYVQILVCIMCRFEHVLCTDFSMPHVRILACIMCNFEHVLFELQSKWARRSARLARFARLHPCMYFPKFVCWRSLLFFSLLNK